MLVFYAVSILLVTSQILCDDTAGPARIRCRRFEEPADCDDYRNLRPLNPSIKIRCVPSCKCIDNYVRNRRGQCVPRIKGPTPVILCPQNEIWVECKTICPPQSCNLSFTSYACAANIECEPGCDCRKDYLRNNSGVCIPKDECPLPIVCGENQVPSDCSDNYSPVPRLPVCIPGCSCIENYVRNSYDECVPIPPVLECGINEEAAACKQVCPPLSCGWDPTTMICRPRRCRPGCNCIKGYLRNDKGVCVPEGQCEIRPRPIILCPQNEIWVECKTVCPPQSCDTLYGAFGTCDPNIVCEPGCDCRQDYLRNNSGVCIPIEECPTPIVCGENQVPSDCSDNYSPVPRLPVCIPGCSCIENYTRNSYDECVPIPPVLQCGINEEAAACKQVCPPLSCRWDPTRMSCRPRPCRPGCNCINGYLRNDRGICIPEGQCPINLECGENEEALRCKRFCPPDTCNWDPTRLDCRQPVECEPGCNCKAGYKRDENGICILEENCPQFCNGDRNATYTDCPSRCFTCNPANAICTKDCRPKGCQCNTGYYLTDDGICVLPQDCPPIPCGRNETYAQCKFDCPTTYCPSDDSIFQVACSPPNPCLGGCVCNRNYLRTNDRKERCILASDCPPVKCTRINERWDPCPPPCFSEYCGNLEVVPKTCNTLLPHVCRPQCVCLEDYRRDFDTDECIPINDCPPVCGENEVPSECSDNYPRPLTVDGAAVERIRCVPGCSCQEGYLRNSKGVCVPLDAVCGINEETNFCIALAGFYCPPCRCISGYKYDSNGECIPDVIPCGRNETYAQCKFDCPTTYCPSDDSIFQVACSPPNPCLGGCVCKGNYLRTNDRKERCILASDCPPVKCTRINERWDPCPPPCFSEYCGNLEVVPKTCNTLLPHVCRPQCVCLEDYRRDFDTDECIPINDCPPVCGENEVPSECSDNYPRPLTVNGAAVERIRCVPGCSCQEGYLRNSKGVCVPLDAVCGINEETNFCIALAGFYCPPCRCISGYKYDSNGECIPDVIPCGRNETYAQCKFDCPTTYCPSDDSIFQVACLPPNPCLGGCVCNRNYLRTNDRKERCILASDCPPVKCTRINERWDPCPPPCFSEYCGNLEVVPKTCNTLLPHVCRPQCVCLEDYRRDFDTDECIPINDCPPVCGENEVPSECSDNYPRPLAVDGADVERIRCVPGCSCQEGYLRNSKGVCVPLDAVCGINEETNFCIALAGFYCPPCRCISGYKYDSNGECIPDIIPCGRNETYAQCKIECPTNYCPRDDNIFQVACLPQWPCPGGCVCQGNYLRTNDEEERCILASDCPPVECTRRNERWNPCPPPCFSEFCGSEMPKICNTPHMCKPQCVCLKDYRRDYSTNECIPKNECPAVVL